MKITFRRWGGSSLKLRHNTKTPKELSSPAPPALRTQHSYPACLGWHSPSVLAYSIALTPQREVMIADLPSKLYPVLPEPVYQWYPKNTRGETEHRTTYSWVKLLMIPSPSIVQNIFLCYKSDPEGESFLISTNLHAM